MLEELLESRPRGGETVTLVRAVGHAMGIATLVAATMDAAPRRPEPPKETVTLVYHDQGDLPEPQLRVTGVRVLPGRQVAHVRLPDLPSTLCTLGVLSFGWREVVPWDGMEGPTLSARIAVRSQSDAARDEATATDQPYFEFQVEKRAVALPGTAPHYPELLRSAGAGGRVLIQFVVDTAGRVEPSTVKLLVSDHTLFTDAVRGVLGRLRFLPAEIGGRKVRQLVQMPFEFRIDRRSAVVHTTAGTWPPRL